MDKKKKNFYIREDLANLFELVAYLEGKKQGTLIDEMIEFYVASKSEKDKAFLYLAMQAVNAKGSIKGFDEMLKSVAND